MEKIDQTAEKIDQAAENEQKPSKSVQKILDYMEKCYEERATRKYDSPFSVFEDFHI